MKRVVLATVMHSGTHLMLYEVFKENRYAGHGERQHVWQLHLENRCMPFIEEKMSEGVMLVTSMRHPARIKASFVKRQDKFHKFDEQMENLVSLEEYNPTYVHIDMPDIRDEQTRCLGERLDLDLSTSWPVNQLMSGSIHGLHDMEVTDEWLSRVNERYVDFYYKTANEFKGNLKYQRDELNKGTR